MPNALDNRLHGGDASMKVPPKRKGNPGHFCHVRTRHASMKVPPKRKGNQNVFPTAEEYGAPQ